MVWSASRNPNCAQQGAGNPAFSRSNHVVIVLIFARFTVLWNLHNMQCQTWVILDEIFSITPKIPCTQCILRRGIVSSGQSTNPHHGKIKAKTQRDSSETRTRDPTAWNKRFDREPSRYKNLTLKYARMTNNCCELMIGQWVKNPVHFGRGALKHLVNHMFFETSSVRERL